MKAPPSLSSLLFAVSACYVGTSGDSAQLVDGDTETGSDTASDSGSDTPGAGPGTPAELPGEPSTVVRLLSRRELGNAIEALVGIRPDALDQLPADNTDLGFDRIVESQTISSLHEDAHAAIADEISAHLLSEDLAAITPACAPASALPNDGPALASARRPCVAAFVDVLTPLAFRRPIDDDERTQLLDLYDAAEGYRDGARQVIRAIFRSPNFLFLIEHGTGAVANGAIALTDHEVAARISFALCETVPDTELRAAADAGMLGDADAITAQAERMLRLPCARETLRSFWTQWLRLGRLEGISRDAALYPDFDTATADAMRRETEAFIDHLLWTDPSGLREVFVARFSILDARTGPLYGIDGLGDEPTRTELPEQRRGVLTHPSVLTVTSDTDATSPVKRGVFVLRSLLCQALPPVPTDIVIEEPPPSDAQTTRERWAQHSADPACSYCHRILDPVGFAMEDFDAIGRHRDVENGRPIDAHGGIPSLGVDDGTLEGAAELSELIADREELRRCFARQWTRFALGRREARTDEPSLTAIGDVVAGDGSLQEAFAALADSPAFRQRAIGDSQ